MRNLFSQLWADEAGLLSLEYLLIMTIIGLGSVVGLAAVSSALNTELTELAEAILHVDQGFSVDNQSNCVGHKDGWDSEDNAGDIVTANTNPTGDTIEDDVCN